jgi:hypothetical protein
MDQNAIQGHGIRLRCLPEFFDEDVAQSQFGEFEFGAHQTCL